MDESKDKLLYYPYVNLPKEDWTLRALLYYDNIGSIVPYECFDNPEAHYEPFMLELVKNELVIPINPMASELSIDFSDFSKRFFGLLNSNRFQLLQKQREFKVVQEKINSKKGSSNFKRILSGKFEHGIFHELKRMELAMSDPSNNGFFIVESLTGDYLIRFLATVISKKLNMLPATDTFNRNLKSSDSLKERVKREIILKELIPFPQRIDLKQLRKFKDQHPSLLKEFRILIDNLLYDERLVEGSKPFNAKMKELEFRKDELYEKMNESRLGQLIFGTICGFISGAISVVLANDINGAITSLPGFANSAYSANQNETAENIFDQSGMKYLALIENKISN